MMKNWESCVGLIGMINKRYATQPPKQPAFSFCTFKTSLDWEEASISIPCSFNLFLVDFAIAHAKYHLICTCILVYVFFSGRRTVISESGFLDSTLKFGYRALGREPGVQDLCKGRSIALNVRLEMKWRRYGSIHG